MEGGILTEAVENDNENLVILEEKSDGDAVILAIGWGDQTISWKRLLPSLHILCRNSMTDFV